MSGSELRFITMVILTISVLVLCAGGGLLGPAPNSRDLIVNNTITEFQETSESLFCTVFMVLLVLIIFILWLFMQ